MSWLSAIIAAMAVALWRYWRESSDRFKLQIANWKLERQRQRIKAAQRLEAMNDKDVADEIDNKIN